MPAHQYANRRCLARNSSQGAARAPEMHPAIAFLAVSTAKRDDVPTPRGGDVESEHTEDYQKSNPVGGYGWLARSRRLGREANPMNPFEIGDSAAKFDVAELRRRIPSSDALRTEEKISDAIHEAMVALGAFTFRGLSARQQLAVAELAYLDCLKSRALRDAIRQQNWDVAATACSEVLVSAGKGHAKRIAAAMGSA